MKCTRVVVDRFSAIVCGPAERKRACRCGRPAERLCDWKVAREGATTRTCDAPVCAKCTTKPAPEKDLCPTHAGEYLRWKEARLKDSGG